MGRQYCPAFDLHRHGHLSTDRAFAGRMLDSVAVPASEVVAIQFAAGPGRCLNMHFCNSQGFACSSLTCLSGLNAMRSRANVPHANAWPLELLPDCGYESACKGHILMLGMDM